MSEINRGGLTPLRLSRAITLLESSVTNRMSLSQIAIECGLSSTYFARAFKVSTGLSPYRWLAQHRIEKASQTLTSTLLPLSEIAAQCGFADQAHFARVFRNTKGVPPSIWRRDMGSTQPTDGTIAIGTSVEAAPLGALRKSA